MRSDSSARAVRMMIGMPAVRSDARTRRHTSRPSTCGSIRSSTIRSGALTAIASSASLPEAARSVVKPALPRYRATSSAISGSSSTTRTRAVVVCNGFILPVKAPLDSQGGQLGRKMLGDFVAPLLEHRKLGGGGVMRAFLATVLSVIAVGVVLIAYGLLVPRAPASGLYPSDSARPVFAGQQIGYVDDLRDPRAVRANEVFVTQAPRPTAPAPVRYETALVRSRRPATRRGERASGRDLAKTAM